MEVVDDDKLNGAGFLERADSKASTQSPWMLSSPSLKLNFRGESSVGLGALPYLQVMGLWSEEKLALVCTVQSDTLLRANWEAHVRSRTKVDSPCSKVICSGSLRRMKWLVSIQ